MLTKKANKIIKIKWIRGNNALFIYLFWFLMFLFSVLFVGNIATLFSNPNKLFGYETNESIFLGYYTLNATTKEMWLNWIPYTIGIFTIIYTILVSISYWWYRRNSINAVTNNNSLVCLYILSVCSLITIFVINIFNRPLILLANKNIDIITNGWLSVGTSDTFNYVYSLTVISSTNAYLSLNKFSAIWIFIIVGTFVGYISTLSVFMYYSQCSFSLFNKMDSHYE